MVFKNTDMAFTNKHTQGNWNAVAYGNENKIGFSTHEIQYSEDGECVAEVVHGEANAKLISAAPELRQCVEMFHDFLNNDKSKNSIAMQAVKKALSKAGVELNNKLIDV